MKNIRGNQWSKAALLSVGSLLAIEFAAPSAAAQSAQAETGERAFSAPAGPLGRTLIAISNTYGVDVVGANDLVAGRSAPAMSGVFSVEEALMRALGGTGLVFTRSQTGVYVVTQQTVEALPPQRRTARNNLLATDTVVVTGRRVARPISQIPNSITVIEPEELVSQFSIDENLNSLLQFSVPGIAATSSSILGNASLRGRTALILIDGVPQNQLIRSSGFDIQTIAPEAIERIEVIRGANAVFGFGATGGVINYITRKAPDEGWRVIGKGRTAFQTSNAEPTKEVYGQAAGRFGRFGVLVGAGFDDLEPRFDGDGNLSPNDETDAGKDITNIHGALSFEIDSNQRLRVSGNYFDRQDSLSDFTSNDQSGSVADNRFSTAFFPGGFFNDFSDTPADATTLPYDTPPGFQTFLNGTITYQHDDVFGSSVEINGLFHDYDLEFPFDRFPEIDVDLRQVRERKRAGVRSSVDTPLDFITEGARLTWGADYISESISEGNDAADRVTGEITRGTDTTIRLTPFIEQDTVGLWGGLEIPFGDFLISGGVRHDIIDANLLDAEFDFGGTFEGGSVEYTATVFNAGLVYYPNENLDLYFSFSQGFDVTDIGRATFQVSSAAQVDPEPAVTDQFEIGVRARTGDFSASLAAFYSDSELASRTVLPEGANVAVPLRQPEEIWGVEASWIYRYDEALDFGGTFTWNDGKRELDDGSTVQLQNNFLSPVTLTAYGNWSPAQWLDARAQIVQNFSSDRFDEAVSGFGNADYENLTLVDFLFRFKSDDIGQFEVGIDNVFDVVDAAPGDRASNSGRFFFPIPGRTVSLTYRYEFGQ